MRTAKEATDVENEELKKKQRQLDTWHVTADKARSQTLYFSKWAIFELLKNGRAPQRGYVASVGGKSVVYAIPFVARCQMRLSVVNGIDLDSLRSSCKSSNSGIHLTLTSRILSS